MMWTNYDCKLPFNEMKNHDSNITNKYDFNLIKQIKQWNEYK